MKWMLSMASVVVMLLAGSLPAGATDFMGEFSGTNEDPPNDSTGTGTAFVELNPVEHTLTVDVGFSDLVSPTTIAHIHCCAPPGMNAGVATAVPTFPGFPAGVTSGSYQMTFDTTLESTFNPGFIANNGGTVASAEAALLEGLNNGLAYFNIHTMMFMNGEIRANLSPIGEVTPTVTVGAGTPTSTLMPGTPTSTVEAGTPTATVSGPTATATGGVATATSTVGGATATATPVGTATATITPPIQVATATATGGATATRTTQVTPTATGAPGTPTATPPGGTPTRTGAVGTATITPSRAPATNTPRTRTPAPDHEDDGCHVAAEGGSSSLSAWLLLLPAAIWVARRRRRKG